MADSLSGKVAAVTGAASGIGLACARAMLEAGARVVLVDLAEDQLQLLCAELGKDAIPLVTNLLDPSSVTRMIPSILEKTGQLDIFHANAAAYVGGEVVAGTPTRGIECSISISTRSSVQFTRFCPTIRVGEVAPGPVVTALIKDWPVDYTGGISKCGESGYESSCTRPPMSC